MKFIIGTKKEMTRRFKEDGTVVPITVVEAQPNQVTGVKMTEKDGYTAVQVAGGGAKKKLSKPLTGFFKGLNASKKVTEFRVTDVAKFEKGQTISVSVFKPGDIVDAIGTSKGHGFTGVMKRHGFKGSKATHGNKDQARMPGSSGATGPAHVFKGKKNPGRMGGGQVTAKNLTIDSIDEKRNEIFIKGAIPGARNSMVIINGAGEMDLAGAVKEQPVVEKEETKIKEEVKKDE